MTYLKVVILGVTLTFLLAFGIDRMTMPTPKKTAFDQTIKKADREVDPLPAQPPPAPVPTKSVPTEKYIPPFDNFPAPSQIPMAPAPAPKPKYQPKPPAPPPPPVKQRVAETKPVDVCAKHNMKKVYSENGRRWRCRKR